LADIRGKLKDDPRLKHFLTVAIACVVQAPTIDKKDSSKLLKPDDTKEVMRRGQDLSLVQLVFVKAKRTTQQRRETEKLRLTPSPREGVLQSTGGIPDAHPGTQKGFRVNQNPNVHRRCHYRIVFEEIGKAVVNMLNYGDMFLAVEGALTGIGAMHDAGYLHRDGSAGNALLVDRGGERVGVIIDLEYAIIVSDTSPPHDTRTGTPAFLPVEVEAQNYTDLELETAQSLLDKDISPPFRQNGFHDIEPFWWVCLWFLFHMIPGLPLRSLDSTFADSYQCLFSKGNAFHRIHAWQSPLVLSNHIDQLPKACKYLGKGLANIRIRILKIKRKAYNDADVELNNPAKLKVPVQEALALLLSKIKDLRALPEVTNGPKLAEVCFTTLKEEPAVEK